MSWPWLFAVNVPIGIATLALSTRLLPRTDPSGHRFDLWSAVLCALMFGSLISGINGLGHRQAALIIAGEFIGTVASGYLLVRRQATQVMPLLPIDLFRRPIFAVSVTTSVLCFIAQGLAFVSLPFYLQDVIGVSAVAT
jgi:DHA2 family multidrug resistance protein-like MFS transporter